jgi:hypothetical protein
METKTQTKYICSECHREYSDKQSALNCETKDKREKRIDNMQVFEMTESHIKLLNNFYVGWDDCEFGAPCIDPKRPYGNSSGVDDVAEVLGIKKTKDNVEDYDKDEAKNYDDKSDYINDLEWNEETYEKLMNLHKETKIALQIVLSTKCFELGKYKKKESYGKDWKKLESEGEKK